ncbi:MAG: peroxidase [Planctomycetota bacterium]
MSSLESGDFSKISDPRQQAALNYAIRLTVNPAQITKQDVDVLRDQGFTDLAIHDLCSITAYFAFVNRIADGLGVELEDEDTSN